MDNFKQTTMQGQSQEVPYSNIQHNLSNIKPTSAEINHLWSTYTAESMSVTMLKHMVAKSKDPDFHNVLQSALDLGSKNLSLIEDLFEVIEHPVPDAFGENDVNPNAPALFDEAFCVRYTRLMTKQLLLTHTTAFTEATRSDFIKLFSDFIDGAKGIIEKADTVLLAKGLFPKSPSITLPDRVDYVHNKKYYGSIYRKKRPLNVLEISSLYALMDFKISIKALALGFSQVAKSKKIRKHLNQGQQLLARHLEALASFLDKDRLPSLEMVD